MSTATSHTSTPSPRRPPGRPPVPPEQRLTARVVGRVTPVDRDRLDRVLQQRGVTEADLVRDLVLRELAAANA